MSRIIRDLSPVMQTRILTPSTLPLVVPSEPDIGEIDPLLQAQSEMAAITQLVADEETKLAQIAQEAAALLEDAREKARELLAQAETQIAHDRQHAYLLGREEGFAHGRAQAESEQQELTAQAQQVLADAQRERKTQILGAEGFVADLAIVIAERVLEREVSQDDSYLLTLTRQLLSEVDKAHRVELRVAVSDFPHLLAHRSTIEKMFYQRVECVILPDHTLRGGDLVVVTEMGTVDGRLDVRLEGVRKVLQSIAKEWERRESLTAEAAEL